MERIRSLSSDAYVQNARVTDKRWTKNIMKWRAMWQAAREMDIMLSTSIY